MKCREGTEFHLVKTKNFCNGLYNNMSALEIAKVVFLVYFYVNKTKDFKNSYQCKSETSEISWISLSLFSELRASKILIQA